MTEADPGAPPLAGLRVVEFAGIGPGPFAGMMLADMGAEMLRVERTGDTRPGAATDVLARGRRSVALDLKTDAGRAAALALIDRADAVMEGYRPGVMERLGLGPDICRARNPRLVYGRMTGWGQTGPAAAAAGHDLNYIALSGALWAMGDADRPPPVPLNIVGDFGGGGMLLAFGMVTALLKAARTGRGDVVDAAICDGTAALMAMTYSMRAAGLWSDRRADNKLDGGAPWYGVYRCADDGWITIGALEPKFWSLLLDRLGLDPAGLGDRDRREDWPRMRQILAETFAGRPRAHWQALLENTDVCFAPVLSPMEAPDHPHNRARGIFVTRDGVVQPAPAPRFAEARTPLPAPPPVPGADTATALADWGLDPALLAQLGLPDAG